MFFDSTPMNLIIVYSTEIDETHRVFLTDQRAQHIRKVLKPEIGKSLRIGILDGPLGEGVVESIDKSGVRLRCIFSENAPMRPNIDILMAMPRPKVLKRLWAQISAMGVDRIILTNAEKVERCYFDTHVLDPDFYTPLLVEGLQQAKDTRLPRVEIHRQLKPFIEDELQKISSNSTKIIADPSGEKRVSKIISQKTDQRVLLAIGPEGGWTPYEIDLLKTHGFIAAQIGSRILRTDTACIALLGIINEALAN